MISFVKGIFYDQSNKIQKMLDELQSPDIDPGVDPAFLARTLQMLESYAQEIEFLFDSGDLEIDTLASYHIIKYNTLNEKLVSLELFRYLVIVNYGEPEKYFRRKIARIYKEVNCLQKQPIVATISNSKEYYWAFPTNNVIAVPKGEEKNLLNLPDLYHEMGHLIYNQNENYLKGSIETTLNNYFAAEIRRVHAEHRAADLIPFFQEKNHYWIDSWVMEFTCDFIATYLVGPAYALTNLKLTTISTGKGGVYKDSPTHPSDEARMRAILHMLRITGHVNDEKEISKKWDEFLKRTKSPHVNNYNFIFPQFILEELANNVLKGCKAIYLRSYEDQVTLHGNPVSKILNDAWAQLFHHPEDFEAWEQDRLAEIKASL